MMDGCSSELDSFDSSRTARCRSCSSFICLPRIERTANRLLTATLVGDTAVSLLLTTRADQIGRRRVLMVGALLMAAAGVVFASTGSLWLFVLAPGNTAAKDEDNACEARAIRDARRSGFWPMGWTQERFQDPTTDLEAARRPCQFTLPRRRGSFAAHRVIVCGTSASRTTRINPMKTFLALLFVV